LAPAARLPSGGGTLRALSGHLFQTDEFRARERSYSLMPTL